MYPKLTIDLNKLDHNVSHLIALMKKHQLSVTAITKLYGGSKQIVDLLEKYPEIEYFGDSRIKNLINYQNSKKKKILIRIPMPSEIAHVITYTDISFNSEISTIKLLNDEAVKQNKIHHILLMVDLGDLREGYYDEQDLMNTVSEITTLPAINLLGLGVNLMCYGGIIPDESNLGKLVALSQKVEQAFEIDLKMISGGNSSSLYLLENDLDVTLPKGINNLRIGDAFFTGESSFGRKFPHMHGAVLTFEAQIVELKEKPSYPIGQISVDAFGKIPTFIDKGMRLKGILAVGRQDVAYDSLYPIDKGLEIIGASSDHLIIDFTESKQQYKVGDIVKFNLHYGAALGAFTSKYVTKAYI